MNLEQILSIIRSELHDQALRHGESAMLKCDHYKHAGKQELLTETMRLSFTSEALSNFSMALTPQKFAEWAKKFEAGGNGGKCNENSN